MHPLPLTDDDCFLIDNSSLERQTTCPRSAEYYLCNRREGSDSRPALGFGGAVHKVLETRYLNLGKPLDEVRRLMVASADAAFTTYEPPAEDYRNYDMMMRLIDGYLERYPIEEGTNYVHNSTPCIEVPFALPIGTLDVNADLTIRRPDGSIVSRHVKTITVVWTGRIDRIYEHCGRLYLQDHKTTSMMGPTYFREFDLSHQVYGYVYSASKLLNKTIYGFCVNTIACRRPTKTGKALEYERYIVPLDQSLLEEWLEDTLHIVSDFIEMARRGYFPKHTKWCVGKYGVCPYQPICSLPPAHREMMLLSGTYKDVTWSPLNQT